jgi:hypothetical protein
MKLFSEWCDENDIELFTEGKKKKEKKEDKKEDKKSEKKTVNKKIKKKLSDLIKKNKKITFEKAKKEIMKLVPGWFLSKDDFELCKKECKNEDDDEEDKEDEDDDEDESEDEGDSDSE